MKWTFHTCVALMLVGSSLAQAQNSLPPAGAVEMRPTAAAPATVSSANYSSAPCQGCAPTVLNEGCGSCCDNGGASGPRVWASADYLLWWTKRAPVPVPLVTTGAGNTVDTGIIGSPDTVVLFGGQNYGFGATSGVRLDVGVWLNSEHTFGIEARGFALEEKHITFTAASGPDGREPLSFPFFDAQEGLENGIIIAQPRIFDPNTGLLISQPFAGSVRIGLSSELWTAELNGVWMKGDCNNRSFACFAGVRFARLKEQLTISDHATDLVNAIDNFLNEGFKTENDFLGGQLGAQLSWHSDLVSLQVRGQVAVGDNNVEEHNFGAILQTGAAAFAPGLNNGGVFVQPTNIGSRTVNSFSVIPELSAEVGFRLLTNLHATIGYDVLWWNNVGRPGEQIDRNLNVSQSPIFGNGSLVGPAAPGKLLNNKTNYMAQGLTFGLAYRY